MATKKCPVCGVSVKVENLERHVRDQHPHAQVDQEGLLTREEKAEVKEARAASRPALTAGGKRWIVIVAVVVAVVLVAAVLVTTLRLPGTKPGQVAPDFTLTTSTGASVTLSALRGTPVVLEFMNTLCPNCQAEAPILSSLYSQYGSRARFLSVDIAVTGEFAVNTASQIETFKSTYGTPWDYAIDTSNSVAGTYGVTGTPTSFVLNGSGVVQNVFVGTHPYSSFSDALNVTLG